MKKLYYNKSIFLYNTGVVTLLTLLKDSTVRRALLVGCVLQLDQQLSGINTVMLVFFIYTKVIFDC